MAETRAGYAARSPSEAGSADPIALIAGAGELPLVMAKVLKDRGRDVFLVAVEGEADQDFGDFSHIRLPIGAAARLLQALRSRRCTDVMMAGAFRRPRFSEIEFDLGTLKLALSSLLRLRWGGDNEVVEQIISIFESEGFRIVSPHQAVPELISPEGPLAGVSPSLDAKADIDRGIAAIRHIGQLDIGQAVIVHDRRIIAVEAAEGTSAMIARCGDLRKSGRLNAPAPSGILVKMPKPGQETRLEMPVVGPDTVREAAESGLAGIAIEAGGLLLVNRERMARLADEAGLFIFGFPAR